MIGTEITNEYYLNLAKLKPFLPHNFVKLIAEKLINIEEYEISRAFNKKLKDLDKLHSILDQATQLVNELKEKSQQISSQVNEIVENINS